MGDIFVNGPEGRIRFPSSMSVGDIEDTMTKLYPPKAPQTFSAPFKDFGMAGSMVESLGQAPARKNVQMLNPPRPPEMQRELMPADYAGAMINMFTNPEPGAETGLPEIGTGLVEGGRKLGTPGQRLAGAAQLVGTAGEAASPLMGVAPLESLGATASEMAMRKAGTLGAGLSTGYLASQGAEKVTRQLGGGKDAQELAAQLGFWLPTAAGAGLSTLMEGGEANIRPRMIDHLAERLRIEGKVSDPHSVARDLVAMYENTGDARYLGEVNFSTPGSRKVLALTAQRAAGLTLDAGQAAILGHDAPDLINDERGEFKVPDWVTQRARTKALLTERPPELSEQVFRKGVELKAQGLNEAETLFHLMKSFPEQADEIATAYGYNKAKSTEMGREAQGTTKPKPESQPISTSETAPRSGESISSSERSEVTEARPDYAARRLAQLAQPERDTNILRQLEVEHPDWTLSQRLQEAARRANPPKAEGKGLAAEDVVLEARKQQIMQKRPGIAEGTARVLAKQELERERGAFSLRPATPQIGPQTAPISWRSGNVLGNLADTLGRYFGDLDAVNDPERTARLVTREMDSKRKLLQLQLEEKLKSSIESHDNDNMSDFRAFMDAGEGKPGAQFLKPSDQLVAQQLHAEFQKRWIDLNNILDKDQDAGIDDYLSHVWRRPGQAKMKLEQWWAGKRPLAGRANFLKKRLYQYASEGLDQGLEPLSMNPIRMQLATLHQIDKFITAHELKDAYRDAGIVEFVKNREKAPLGWQKLNDRLFQPELFKEGGLVKYGTYWAPPEVARIFNRYLDPGLSGNLAYDTLRNYGNLLNQVNLGLSGYHGSFITIVAGSSDVALGLEKLVNNHDMGGVRNILRGTAGNFSAPFDLAIQGIADRLGKTESVEKLVGVSSAGRFYRRGRAIQKEALSPSTGPKTQAQSNLQAFVDDLVKAGANFKQDSFYRTPEGQKFWRGLYQTPQKLFTEGPVAGFKQGYRTVQAGIQRFPVTRAIMDYYVPRVKLGMASYMMEAKMAELAKNGIYDDATIRTELSKIWDSVDNRAGQMKYDNLFWNKSAKDLSFLAVRAVGWDLGTAREIGGAGLDVMSGLSKLAKGERPSTYLSGRAAFVLGTTITLGTIGAVMTYLATGKPPQSLLDYFHPPTGRTGTNGKPERYSLPTYAKDVENFWHHPMKTVVSKLHPDIEQLYEFYNNRDFQDTQIYDNGDPLWRQGIDILRWWGKTALPFAATTTLARERGGEGLGPGASKVGIAIESFFGLQRANREVSSSKAEDYIFENAKRYWEAGPVSRTDRERRELFFKFRTQQRLGTLNNKDAANALRNGEISDNDFDRIYDDAGLTNAQSEFKFLASHDPSAAIKAIQMMKPEERSQYRAQVADMMDHDLERFDPETQMQYMKEIRGLMRAPSQ